MPLQDMPALEMKTCLMQHQTFTFNRRTKEKRPPNGLKRQRYFRIPTLAFQSQSCRMSPSHRLTLSLSRLPKLQTLVFNWLNVRRQCLLIETKTAWSPAVFPTLRSKPKCTHQTSNHHFDPNGTYGAQHPLSVNLASQLVPLDRVNNIALAAISQNTSRIRSSLHSRLELLCLNHFLRNSKLAPKMVD